MCCKAASSFLFLYCLSIFLSVGHCQAVENFDASNLTLQKQYTFAKPDSYLLISASGNVSTKLIQSKREIFFDFRTRYSNGILLHENYFDHSIENSLYELYLILHNSRLKVLIHSQGKQEEFFIGYGFNKDKSHHINLYFDPHLGYVNIRANSTSSDKYYKSLYFNSSLNHVQNEPTNYHYTLSLGGIPNSNQSLEYELKGLRNFVGCIGNIKVVSRSNSSNFGTLSSSHVYYNQVEIGCIDQCEIRNLCSRNAQCINYYDKKECDCFTTKLEDWQCRSYNYTEMTFRGYSTISYVIYRFADKTYSNEHLVSFHLKTEYDAILFVALSETKQNYLILNIKNGFFNLLFDLGNNPENYIFNDFKLTDNKWHNVTVVQKNQKMFVSIDEFVTHIIQLKETNTYSFFDPEIYFGGLPTELNIFKINLPIYLPNKKFVGCLKHVYFNSINVLYDLNSNHRSAKYHSLFPIELGCNQINSLPITIQPKSMFKVSINKTNGFLLEFDFKSPRTNFQIANGTFITKEGDRRKWHLLIRKLDVKLSVEAVSSQYNQIAWTLSNDNSLSHTNWNKIKIINENNDFILMSVNQIVVKGRYDSIIGNFYGNVTIGSIDNKFIGCVRNVIVNNKVIEPRTLRQQEYVFGKVSLDNCQLVDPCNRPNLCEHGGTCISVPENGSFFCDCSNTGYTGRTCHFSLYRKSCEEIFLMDKQHSGIFMIDIDRNGPLPPAHVACKLDDNHNGTIRTVIEHNIQHQVIVREKGREQSYYMDVVYRDFNQDMLRMLIRKSTSCRQYVRYECNNAPLNLSTYTLLYSTTPDHKLVRINGNSTVGCQCGTSPNKCVDTRKRCNCDADLPGWNRDEGYLTHSDDVGITKMFFLKFPNVTDSSEAHLFIGNLSCINPNTQRYEITFKTKESYLEVPGWKGKEMGISFRTTANKAVIFYQAHLDSMSTYFKAVIKSENEVSFEYVMRGRKHVVTVTSDHCLNCGQWQHIWIERNVNQMRVSINQNLKILYLKDEDKFIDLDGKLFVGGAPLRYLKGLNITLGFIGCLRGLVFDDDEVINLHRYLNHIKMPNIETGCRPYCRPNLCQNQGVCVELWGSYRCECSNPIAHSGRNCEVNINENSITFKEPTFIRKIYGSVKEIQSILQEDIILSFRTHSKSALLLYAHDIYKNFLQLHIENGTNVVMTYNSYRRIVRREISIGSLLTSGHTNQVKIDRRYQNHTVFTVNKNQISIPYPVRFLRPTESFWTSEDSTVLALLHPSHSSEFDQNELFVGGVDKESVTSIIPPFVGCIQGVVVGGKLLNVKEMAASLNAVNMASVKPGCKMLCDQIPCKNGGICTEDWKNESIKCDCDSTSYRGKLCDIDIGVYFEKNSSVVYYLDDVIMDFDHIDITFAFSTVHMTNSSLFLLLYANSTRYLHIALLDDGRIMVEEDNGHDIYFTYIENEEDDFQDSNRHWIHYVRKKRSAQIIVDSIIYMIFETYKETQPELPNGNDNLIMIGSSKIRNQLFHQYTNFIGCISNINIALDNFKIDPLESAFGMRSGLDKIKVFGVFQQGKCASFKALQTSVSNTNVEQTVTFNNREEIWLNRPKPSLILFKKKGNLNKSHKFLPTKVIIAICAAYLLIIMILVCLYLWKIEKKYRLLKFQGETPFFHKNSNFNKKNYAM